MNDKFAGGRGLPRRSRGIGQRGYHEIRRGAGSLVVALLGFLAAASGFGEARAQPAFERLSLPQGVELAIPAGLREVAAPAAAAGSDGTLARVFTDGAARPLTLWVQVSPSRTIERLPNAADAAQTQELANGFATGLQGAYEVSLGTYDASRGAFSATFKVRGPSRAAEFAAEVSTYSSLAFLTRQGTVLALTVATAERQADVAAAAAIIWEHTTLRPGSRLPVDDSQSWSGPNVGRRIGIVLGSLIGAFALGGAGAWLLVKAGMAGRLALALAGGLLVALGALGVMRHQGSLDSSLQLFAYVLASGVAYARFGDWLDTRARRVPPLEPPRSRI